jgi:hypothetical protein
VPYADFINPQTLNLYAMVHDNPETFADLDGHNGWLGLGGEPIEEPSELRGNGRNLGNLETWGQTGRFLVFCF